MRRLISILLLILTYLSLPAQRNPQPHFRNYSTQHGLPSPEVYFAFQDSRGYLWFGTDNGAARFDGYAFRTYDARDGLTSNVVFNIHEDVKGRIWFGTMTGEAFILERDTIVPYRYNHLVQRHQKQFNTAKLKYLDQDETAYFELVSLGILQIDARGRDSLITSTRPLSRLAVDINGTTRFLRTYIGRFNEKDFGGWLDYENKHRLVQVEFAFQKGRVQIELPHNIGFCEYAWDVQKFSSGHYLVVSCGQLFCLKEEELLWTIPFSGHTAEIIEDESQAIWFCLLFGKGLRRYRDLDALRNGEYDLFLDGLSISNIYQGLKGLDFGRKSEVRSRKSEYGTK